MAVPLSRESIVSAALSLVDREGLKALSMRRLGSELGVDPMAIYYHVPNKDALLDAIVEAVMSQIDLAIDDSQAPAEERVLTAARAYRNAMLAHANALPVVLERGPKTLSALRPVEILVKIFREAGLEPAEAAAAMNAVAAAVRGSIMMLADADSVDVTAETERMAAALPREEFPFLFEVLASGERDMEAEFEWAIRAMTRGLIEAPRLDS